MTGQNINPYAPPETTPEEKKGFIGQLFGNRWFLGGGLVTIFLSIGVFLKMSSNAQPTRNKSLPPLPTMNSLPQSGDSTTQTDLDDLANTPDNSTKDLFYGQGGNDTILPELGENNALGGVREKAEGEKKASKR